MQEQMNAVLKNLGIAGECIRSEQHRHLAFFDIKLDQNATALKKLENNTREIALHMKSKTIPTAVLVPEEGIVRLQMALMNAAPIGLNTLYANETIPTDKMVFPILLGEDDAGKKVWMDLNDCPHLLIAGGTGSGKSTLLHTLIANALYLNEFKARNVWICLADPKRVEFPEYNNPLFAGKIQSVVSTYKDVIAQLNLIYRTMEERYKQMQAIGMRSIEDKPVEGVHAGVNEFPLIFAIIDEVSDLMGQQGPKKEMEGLLVKIAQKGRAAGIYLVLSTQRPSVDVITGLIKANFPGRIACKTASRKDSEIILDRCGAENLLGRGDAMLQNMKHSNIRFQVSYIEPKTVVKTVKWIREQNNV